MLIHEYCHIICDAITNNEHIIKMLEFYKGFSGYEHS